MTARIRDPKPSSLTLNLKLDWSRTFRIVLLMAIGLYVVASAVRVYVRKYYIFLPDYVRWSVAAAPAAVAPTHLFFLFVDHFEPSCDAARVRRWNERYKALALRHRDSDGRPPRHTFFYPGEQHAPGVLAALRDMAAAHLAEVELHYHHDYDTAQTLRPKLRAAIGDMQHYGFLETIDGRTNFAFIHGNWGLDNSNGAAMCGVNGELKLLRELGCFGDFTFPSVFEASQPPFVNNIYAARDDDAPKSYERQLPLASIRDGSSDLVIFQGPLIFAPSLHPSRLFLDLDDGDIHPAKPPSPSRVDRWVRANIHVPGRPEWVFVKVFAHGVSSDGDEDAVLGPAFDSTLSYLEHRYNDGRSHVLHYVTAREAYNLVRAAADGHGGDPQRWYDYVIPPYMAAEARE